MNMVWITGLISGIFFILNFSTCYSMPWSNKKLFKIMQKKLSSYHKPIAWLTVLSGLLHIIIAFLWYFHF